VPTGDFDRFVRLVAVAGLAFVAFATPARAFDRASTPGGSVASEAAAANDARTAPSAPAEWMQGDFRYMADAAIFRDCVTGRSYPVAMEGEYLALERAYLAADKSGPGAPLFATFEGSLEPRPAMEGAGERTTVVVRRFVGVWPEQSCERSASPANLSDQHWRVASVRGTPAIRVPGRREAHVILRTPPAGYAASAGCDRLDGSWRAEGSGIAFEPPRAFSAACPDDAKTEERALVGALTAARRWAIHGSVLELFDVDGRPVAVLEAIALR
jgi:heat shock protein HslJ